MDIPDGYSDIPSGKTVSVVTHLQMFQRPPDRAERSEASWDVFARSMSQTPVGTARYSSG